MRFNYQKYIFSLLLSISLSLGLNTVVKAVEPENYKLLKVADVETYTQPTVFTVEMFRLNEYGISQGACQKEDRFHGCGDQDHPYPNDTNYWEVDIENFYMPNTLPEEVNTAPRATLESVAVAIRSYALHLDYYGVDSWHLDNTVSRQVFAPYSKKATVQTNRAVDDTNGIFLKCGSNCPSSRQGLPAFAEHSAAHPNYFTTASTDLSNHPYLAETYDPIYSQDNNGHGRGLAQQSAIQLGLGVGQNGTPYPPLDPCNMLAHFYLGVDFDCFKTALPTPTEYRTTFIYLGGLDNQEDAPLQWRRGSTHQLGFVIQNTGDNPFTLTPQADCNDYEKRTVALGMHWYTYPNYQLLEFEGSRIVLCEEIVNGTIRSSIAPGEVYPAQTGIPQALFGNVWVPDTVSPGLYWLRLDMEFLPPHTSGWGSRLDPNNNVNDAHWPTQDIMVQVLPAPFNIPKEPVVDSINPAPATWTKNNTIALTWHNDDTIDHYLYAWQHQDSFEGWQQTSQTTLSETRPDGQNRFYLQAVNVDGEVSDMLELGPWLIDTTPPTVTLSTLSPIITYPLQSDIQFSWAGQDTSNSSLFFNVSYAQQSPLAEPPPNPPSVKLALTTTTEINLSDLGFSLQAGYIYHFWVQASDEASNFSDWVYSHFVYQPGPMFAFDPPFIKHYQLLITTTATQPITYPLEINNIGYGNLSWTVTTHTLHSTLNQYSGLTPNTLILTLTYPLTVGVYQMPLTFTGPISTYNNPSVLPLTIYVVTDINKIYLPLIFKQ